jgi:tetratricopeptide (TPR) repeat protein
MRNRPVISVGSGYSADQVRSLLALILNSDGFRNHPRARAFLVHVVERTLAGRAAEIKESTIGVEVFRREASYNTKADPVVRTVAKSVRDKLNAYYQSLSRHDPFRIELPQGSYVPEFRAVAADADRHVSPPLSPSHAYWIFCVLCAAVILLSVAPAHPGRDSRSPASIPPALAADPAALYSLGRTKLASGDFPGARPLLEKAAASAPRNALIHAALADDLRLMGYGPLALAEGRLAEAGLTGLSEHDQLEVEASFRATAGDFAGSHDALDRLRRLNPDRLEYVRAEAEALRDNAEFAECLRFIAETSAASARSNDPQLLLIAASCRAASGDYGGALAPVHLAASLAQKAGIEELYARSRLLESGILASTGHIAGSVPLREEARNICAALGDLPCALSALRIQANLDFGLTGPLKALPEFEEALKLAREIGSTGEVGNALTGIGLSRALIDDFDGANAAFAEEMSQLEPSSAGPLFGNQAEVAILQGQLARASMLARRAASGAHQAGDRNSEIVACLILAKAQILTGDLSAAQLGMDRIDKLAVGIKLPSATRMISKLASAAIDRAYGRLETAERELDQARILADDPNDSDLSTERTELLLNQGRYAEARRTAASAISVLEGTGRKSEIALLTALLSDSLGFEGRLPEARQTMRSARALISSRSASLARILVLVSCGRWEGEAAESKFCFEEAIDQARRSGFELAQQQARRARAMNRTNHQRDAVPVAARVSIR